MNWPETEKTAGKPRILVAPLDWGLGHATRCIPIIRELLLAHADVWLAGEGAQQELLRTEFPQLPFLTLEGYRTRYGRTKRGLIWQILVKAPRLLSIIRKENAWLQKVVEKYGFDAVISDNRYGLRHLSVPTVFITHQLRVRSPLGKWSENIIQRQNYGYINGFSQCWIPDYQGSINLAGELSHPIKLPNAPLTYSGPLSRFEKLDLPITTKHLLILLSGPEPQRSLLEDTIVAQVSKYNGTATVVRGLPASATLIPSTNMLKFYNHLPATLLNEEMNRAEYVISRTGYSTVMDIAALRKKSVLIPTPGQTEQEYLGEYLMNQKFSVVMPQKNFSLDDALNTARNFDYQFNDAIVNNHELKSTVTTFLHSLP